MLTAAAIRLRLSLKISDSAQTFRSRSAARRAAWLNLCAQEN
jgi:hypothetical protein